MGQRLDKTFNLNHRPKKMACSVNFRNGKPQKMAELKVGEMAGLVNNLTIRV